MDAISLHCARCDYDLRMLDPAGVCPECALPIAQSVLASTDPLSLAGRTRIRLACAMLLLAMAIRLWIALQVLGYYLLENNGVVYASITSQLFDLWPVDGVTSSALWIFRPGGKWILVRALLVVDFALFCAGVAVLTNPLRPPQRTWALWLRRIARWSAAASILYLASLRVVLDRNARTILAWFYWINPNALIACAMIIPPTALAAWTARLLFLSARHPEARRTRMISAFGVVITLLAAIYNAQWIYERGRLARLGALANVLAFATIWWTWWQLRRRTHPAAGTGGAAGGGADTMP